MRSTDASKPANSSRLLRETVYEQLRADMISCRLAPGTEIREAELAARFEVSKSPVRDALMRLEREGLVISLPRQGYRVAPVSLKDVQDMFHLRAALERACMERIVLYASDEQLEELNAFRHFNASEWNGGFVVYNRAFHHRLAQLGTNIRMRDHLIDLIDPKQLAQVNPGDSVELAPDGPRLNAHSNGKHVGYVEPRVAARLLKLIADGNKYTAGVTSLGEHDVRIIIRETYQDPANYGKVSFPTAAKITDLRPYTKGTLIREEMDLEDDLELDDEDDEIEDIGRVVPDDLTTDEAFVEEESADEPGEEDEA